ncbi:hypothetical protein EYF80_065860 [Liparis tanakae]|uniref:Uncharacterized protein n=1 Tax=Liparis tanakae TaxID=230148 RepID=A0A4Z2E5M0_9TELE|nr:hypothetical protein EYF80_065860 [Liparis tanakae]
MSARSIEADADHLEYSPDAPLGARQQVYTHRQVEVMDNGDTGGHDEGGASITQEEPIRSRAANHRETAQGLQHETQDRTR